MGGTIFVAVRQASGRVFAGTTWTNWLPRLFAEPSLYTPDGGSALKELRDYWKVKRSSSDRVRNSEYGVVLLDLKLRKGEARPQLWDSNGYFSPMRLTLGSPGTCTDWHIDRLALEHMKRGCTVSVIPRKEDENNLDDTRTRDVDGWVQASEDEFGAIAAAYEAWVARVRGHLARGVADAKVFDVASREAWEERGFGGESIPFGILNLDMADVAHRDNHGPTTETWREMTAWLKKRRWPIAVNKSHRRR